MFNFKEALGYLFKEKNWGVKFLIIYIAQALVTVPSSIMSLIQSSATANSVGSLPQIMNLLDSNSNGSNSLNYFDTVSKYNPQLMTNAAMVFLIYFLIILIPYILVIFWYNYETIQAGIQDRQTKPIWKENIVSLLKKDGKYFLVSLIYGLVLLAVIFVIVFTVGIIGSAFLGLTAGAFSSTKGVLATSILGFGSLFVLVCCCLSIVILVLSIIYYLFIMPTLLRLIGSNTFSEAFKISENWHIGQKYKSQFLSVFGIIFLFAFGIGFFSGILNAVARAIYNIRPFFGITFEILIQLIFTALL